MLLSKPNEMPCHVYEITHASSSAVLATEMHTNYVKTLIQSYSLPTKQFYRFAAIPLKKKPCD